MILADIWVKLHVVAEIDPERVDDEDYVMDKATDAIVRNDVLDAEVWSVDIQGAYDNE